MAAGLPTSTDICYFHLPELSALDLGVCRSPGPGLGNLLFPISRALIGRERHGGQFVYPTMRQLKIGTFLRRERDKRTYGAILRGRTLDEWRHWLAARTRTSVSEGTFDGARRGITVRYAGLGRYFHDIGEHHQLIAEWLRENTRSQMLRGRPDIGIHVRLGDFTEGDPNNPGNSIRQPLDWYRAAFEEALPILGMPKPSVVLFTDSEPHKVKRDLDIESISIDDSENALLSMLHLSRSRLLIASRSTFSMWAAYLGNMPAIWDRRYDRTRFLPNRPGLDHAL